MTTCVLQLHHWLQPGNCCPHARGGKQGPGNHRILLLDIKKAFVHGKISMIVHIKLPSEDPMSEGVKHGGQT